MHSGSSANISNASAMQQAAAMLTKPPGIGNVKPGQNQQQGGKPGIVVCEICDGYIKDLDQLRNHMQWMHKVKVIKQIYFLFMNVNHESQSNTFLFSSCRYIRK